MTADEARKLANETLDIEAIQSHLDYIHRLVERKAKDGLMAITHIYSRCNDLTDGASLPQLTHASWIMVAKALHSEGFEVLTDPVFGAVDALSWLPEGFISR